MIYSHDSVMNVNYNHDQYYFGSTYRRYLVRALTAFIPTLGVGMALKGTGKVPHLSM